MTTCSYNYDLTNKKVSNSFIHFDKITEYTLGHYH